MYKPEIKVDNKNLSVIRKIKRKKPKKKLDETRRRITCGVCRRVIKWSKHERWGSYAESQRCTCNKKLAVHYF